MRLIIISAFCFNFFVSTIFAQTSEMVQKQAELDQYLNQYNLVAEKYPGLESSFQNLYKGRKTIIREFKTEKNKIIESFKSKKITREQGHTQYKILIGETKPKLNLVKEGWKNILRMYKETQQEKEITAEDLGLESLTPLSVIKAHESGNVWCRAQGQKLKEKEESGESVLAERQYEYSFGLKECQRRGKALAGIWAENWKKRIDAQPLKQSDTVIDVLKSIFAGETGIETLISSGLENVTEVDVYENIPLSLQKEIENQAAEMEEAIGTGVLTVKEVQAAYLDLAGPYLAIELESAGEPLRGLQTLIQNSQEFVAVNSIKLRASGLVLGFGIEDKKYEIIPFLNLAYLERKEEDYLILYLNSLGIKTDDIKVVTDANVLWIESEELGLSHGFGVFDERLKSIPDINSAAFDIFTGNLMSIEGEDVSALLANDTGGEVKAIRFDLDGGVLEFK